MNGMRSGRKVYSHKGVLDWPVSDSLLGFMLKLRGAQFQCPRKQ